MSVLESHHHCESCGMPVQTARYCAYCTDGDGHLQTFDARLDALTAQILTEHRELSWEDAVRSARRLMAEMPAWRDHPRIVGLRQQV
ncbi:zinc ribbon domain-containing protein [Gordonia sp. NPDC003424]